MEIELQLIRATARQVKHWLASAMTQECNGCFHDHPSQVQHECVMLEDEDRIRFCLNKALDLVDWKKVSDDWWQHLSFVQTMGCPRRFEDLNWLRELWNYQDMNESLVVALLNL